MRVLVDRYERLDARHAEHAQNPKFDSLMNLAEREVLSSLEVSIAILGGQKEAAPSDARVDPAVERILRAFPGDLTLRWRGANFALSPDNPDAARHFCTSAREILAAILELNAADDEVGRAYPDELTADGRPTRRARIKFHLQRKSIAEDALSDFVEADFDHVLELFHDFNKGTHGSAGRFSLQQLIGLRKRVEHAIEFLAQVVA